MQTKIHVVPHEGQWALRHAGSREPIDLLDTQQAALEKAVEVAHEEECDVVVHRRDGSFRNVINYEAVERRAEANEGSHLISKQLAWCLFAAGAATAAAIYLSLHPPCELRRLARRLEKQRPDWLRLGT